jgi:purine-binding chemotaxis protein CheW
MSATAESKTLIADANLASLAGKYLTFTLDRESFAIPVIKVREIIRLTAITAVPQMPAYVKGVINLRGKIIPVVDLRTKFDMSMAETTERTCIVVVQVNQSANRHIQMGLVVDDVEEVVNISPGEIEETPDFGSQLDTQYILGMAKIKGAVKSLLDIDRILVGTTQPLAATIAG